MIKNKVICAWCGDSFTNKISLANHFDNVHGIKPEATDNQRISPDYITNIGLPSKLAPLPTQDILNNYKGDSDD